MLETAGALFAAAAVNLRSTWRSFAMTDLAYKAIAFAVLMPATSWLIYWFRAGTSHRVIADVDIARFFITTPAGIVTLIVGTSMILAITALEIACLMGISLGNAKGVRFNTRGALRFGSARSLDVLCGSWAMPTSVRPRTSTRTRRASPNGVLRWRLSGQFLEICSQLFSKSRTRTAVATQSREGESSQLQ